MLCFFTANIGNIQSIMLNVIGGNHMFTANDFGDDYASAKEGEPLHISQKVIKHLRIPSLLCLTY